MRPHVFKTRLLVQKGSTIAAGQWSERACMWSATAARLIEVQKQLEADPVGEPEPEPVQQAQCHQSLADDQGQQALGEVLSQLPVPHCTDQHDRQWRYRLPPVIRSWLWDQVKGAMHNPKIGPRCAVEPLNIGSRKHKLMLPGQR